MINYDQLILMPALLSLVAAHLLWACNKHLRQPATFLFTTKARCVEQVHGIIILPFKLLQRPDIEKEERKKERKKVVGADTLLSAHLTVRCTCPAQNEMKSNEKWTVQKCGRLAIQRPGYFSQGLVIQTRAKSEYLSYIHEVAQALQSFNALFLLDVDSC